MFNDLLVFDPVQVDVGRTGRLRVCAFGRDEHEVALAQQAFDLVAGAVPHKRLHVTRKLRDPITIRGVLWFLAGAGPGWFR